MLENKAYYSPEEVAEYLSVSPETIRNLCRRGEIPGARQVGRQWRIPRSYLDSNPTVKDDDTSTEKH
ncbi:MAG: helix-turn-helix domain-containing protein [Ktedonobacteraceae bacterium]|nr:helix-turn-helix domain-containing protein [Ktedonobacteraceae bacterium]